MDNTKTSGLDQISLKELIEKILVNFSFLSKKWKVILLAGIIGGLIGYIYSNNKPVTYTAKLTFILEEGKSGASGLGGLASLAGQFGVDVGVGSGGNVLSGDNILLYFKSPSLAKEVLLSQFDSLNKETIADAYIRFYSLNKIWEKNEKIGKIDFRTNELSPEIKRTKDSLLQKIIENIITYEFDVIRPDKKATFIDVTVKMRNEILAKMYCEKIVQRVVERYTNIKIQRQKATVDKLQIRADSISLLLGLKTVSGATLQNLTNTLDINPLYRTGTAVAVENTIRDKTLLSTIYASVVQNLELAKFNLSQETPVIQIIDQPVFPLKMDKLSKLKTSILFSLSLALTISLLLLLIRLFTNLK